MSGLPERLTQRIRLSGPITIADYMTEALLDPAGGYYMRQDPFGAAGDFITAPEISQMFGELIGLWCADAWHKMGTPDPVLLVELGPGRGTLMADALRAARAVPAFRRALRLHLVEASRSLRAAQASKLAEVEPAWHDSFDRVPAGPLILIANEFFDALPIRQFVRTDDGWHERLVDVDESGFRFVLAPTVTDLRSLVADEVMQASAGSTAEVSPAGRNLAAAIAGRIAGATGAALIVDYGPARSAPGNSLQAVRAHRFHPVLEAPGSADLTAHVDFEALAKAAAAAGARVHGPLPQGAFLQRLGIEARAGALKTRATPEQAADLDVGLARLTGTTAMGTLFKALALAHPALPVPAGFDD